jgi:hypothetical protein
MMMMMMTMMMIRGHDDGGSFVARNDYTDRRNSRIYARRQDLNFRHFFMVHASSTVLHVLIIYSTSTSTTTPSSRTSTNDECRCTPQSALSLAAPFNSNHTQPIRGRFSDVQVVQVILLVLTLVVCCRTVRH